MAEMIISDENCTKCKLSKDCVKVCKEGRGSFNAPLMIIRGNPSRDEQLLVTFGPQEALLMTALFEVIGAEQDEVYMTYAVKCHAGDTTISKKEITACREYLIGEVLRIKPKAILVMGEDAMKMLGMKGTLAKKRGLPESVSFPTGDVMCIPTYTTEWINKNQKYLTNWANDIQRAYNLSKGIVKSNSPTKMVFCDTLHKIKELVGYIKETGLAVFDFETVEIDEDKGTFHEDFYATLLSFSFQAGSGYAIPLFHKDSCYSEEEVYHILDYLRRHVFENPDIRKCAQNLDFDAHVLRFYGIELRGRLDDTMLMHHLYDETKQHGLKLIVADIWPEYAGYDDELKGFKWSEIPMALLSQYGVTDTDFTYRLMVLLESWLQEDPRIYRIYRNLTMAAFKPIFRAECRGMDINKQFLSEAIREVDVLIQRETARLRDNRVVKRYEDSNREKATAEAIDEQTTKLAKWRETHEKMTATEQKMIELLQDLKSGKQSAYEPINFGSWQQLQKLLYFDKEGFRFSSFDTSTGEDVIKELPDTTGFISGLLQLRSLQKTQSTYLRGLYRRLDKNDRVHTSIKLSGTVSGRTSSANPNLQNIPNVAKLKDETLIHVVGLVKKAFSVPENHTLLQHDYKQAELRIIADFADETNMLEVFSKDGDIHSNTGAALLKVELADFDAKNIPEHKGARSKAKAVNFGLIYGMSAKGFKDYAKSDYDVTLTLEEAEETRNLFFEKYPKLLDYHEDYIAKARKFGWVRTLYGRKRHTRDIHNEDDFKRSMDERVAINSPIQGTAGEFMIFAIALLYNRMDPRVEFVNTVHDSVLHYAPDGMVDYAKDIVSYTMENLPNMQYFGVDLPTVGMGTDVEGSKVSWKDLTEI